MEDAWGKRLQAFAIATIAVIGSIFVAHLVETLNFSEAGDETAQSLGSVVVRLQDLVARQIETAKEAATQRVNSAMDKVSTWAITNIERTLQTGLTRGLRLTAFASFGGAVLLLLKKNSTGASLALVAGIVLHTSGDTIANVSASAFVGLLVAHPLLGLALLAGLAGMGLHFSREKFERAGAAYEEASERLEDLRDKVAR